MTEVQYAVAEHIATITLDRPAARNAMPTAAWLELAQVAGSADKGRITREVPPDVARDRAMIDEFVGMA